MNARAFAALAVAAVLAAGGCRAAGEPRTQAAMAKWLISGEAIALLAGAGMPQSELSTDFDVASTYLTVGGIDPVEYAKAVRTQSFTSLDAMRSALDHGLDQSVRAVLYDNEAWSLTPAAEQQDPAGAQSRAAELAHSHHLLLIATPATDLTRVLAPGENPYAAYLRLGISAAAAKVADVIDIQAQGSESDTARYSDFVRGAAAAAHAANPHVVVLAGLSTNPSGQSVTAGQLRAAVDATRSVVDGYWLNIPKAGKACPRCGTAQPQVAVALLRQLS
ncbi:hypothetical protein ACFXHA_29665 [Nocardia sp. NPDC059240]|uniref:hypothetical protein n=1 Tax=Nocardia sp. NPDC059240 TaxID=3346786 RepID=UPI0036C7C81D